MAQEISQQSFWEEENRLKKLMQKKSILDRLAKTVPWEDFRPLLESIFEKERKSPAGRKRIDVLIIFKMLVVQQVFNFSGENLEYGVNENRSLEQFIGLKARSSVPDATTVALFRKRLRDAGVTEELSHLFNKYLKAEGLEVRGGQIIDSAPIPVLEQHN